MKFIVEIADRDAEFGIRVLESLAFIKKTKPISPESAKLFEDLKKAAKEVKLHKEGKIQLKSARELLNEL